MESCLFFDAIMDHAPTSQAMPPRRPTRIGSAAAAFVLVGLVTVGTFATGSDLTLDLHLRLLRERGFSDLAGEPPLQEDRSENSQDQNQGDQAESVEGRDRGVKASVRTETLQLQGVVA